MTNIAANITAITAIRAVPVPLPLPYPQDHSVFSHHTEMLWKVDSSAYVSFFQIPVTATKEFTCT